MFSFIHPVFAECLPCQAPFSAGHLRCGPCHRDFRSGGSGQCTRHKSASSLPLPQFTTDEQMETCSLDGVCSPAEPSRGCTASSFGGSRPKISKSCVVIICWCMIDHPKTWLLETVMAFILLTNLQLGQGLAGWLSLQQLPSSGAAGRNPLKTHLLSVWWLVLAVGGTSAALWLECLHVALRCTCPISIQ